VQRILARHGRRIAQARSQERVFRRPPAAPGAIHYLTTGGHRVAWRLNVHVARHSHFHDAGRRTVMDHIFHSRAAPARTLVTRRDVLIDHLTARERRIESSTTVKDLLTRVIERRAVTMPRRAGAAFRPAPAVPMMVRRLPAPAAQDAPKPASPPRPRDDWTTPAAPKLTQTAPTPIPLTPSELGRLTEHVVGALDRKFTAHRERFGSI